MPHMCTNLTATAQEIPEAVADPSAIKQDFHDLEEVEGIGRQQTPNYWASGGGTEFERTAPHAGGAVGLEQTGEYDLRPQRFAVG